MSSAKCQPFCWGLNVIMNQLQVGSSKQLSQRRKQILMKHRTARAKWDPQQDDTI